MKKIISIVLLCAMLLACLAGCGAKQGQIDLNSYAGDAVAENISGTPAQGVTSTLKTNAEKAIAYYGGATDNGYTFSSWDGSTADTSWYDAAVAAGKKEATLTSAAQLRGLLAKIGASSNAEKFEGWTIKLGTNVDLGNANWPGNNSNYVFQGTFDGQNYVIANYTVKITSSCRRGFFGSLGAGGTIQNVAIVNARHIDAETSSDKVDFGFLMGRAITGSGTITVNNVYCASTHSLADTRTKAISNIGMIGVAEGNGNVVVQNCEFAGSIQASGSAVGAFIGKSTAKGSVTISNCVNNGTISSLVQNVGGLVGQVANATSLSITNCTNNGSVTGSGYAAGILGRVTTSGTVSISGCTVSKNVVVTGGVNSGGIVGYITDVTDVELTNCSFAGKLTADRGSGGVLGFLDVDYTVVTENQSALINDCDVTSDAILDFEIIDAGNTSVGGIVGRVRAPSFELTGCGFAGKMTATFTVAEDEGTAKKAAAGLVGVLFDDSDAQAANANGSVTNCTVTGTLRFLDNTDALFTAAIFVGGSSAWTAPTITYSGLTCNGVTVDTSAVKDGEKGTPVGAIQNGNGPTVIGYQTTDAYAPEGSEAGAEATLYDLRYVAVLNDSANVVAAGFKVTINYKTVEGGVETKVNKITDYIVYADTMYTSIKGTAAKPAAKEIEYTAESFYGDYLYTLVIKGIDVDYTTAAGTLEVFITPFTAVDADTITEGFTADHGTIVITEPQV